MSGKDLWVEMLAKAVLPQAPNNADTPRTGGIQDRPSKSKRLPPGNPMPTPTWAALPAQQPQYSGQTTQPYSGGQPTQHAAHQPGQPPGGQAQGQYHSQPPPFPPYNSFAPGTATNNGYSSQQMSGSMQGPNSSQQVQQPHYTQNPPGNHPYSTAPSHQPQQHFNSLQGQPGFLPQGTPNNPGSYYPSQWTQPQPNPDPFSQGQQPMSPSSAAVNYAYTTSQPSYSAQTTPNPSQSPQGQQYSPPPPGQLQRHHTMPPSGYQTQGPFHPPSQPNYQYQQQPGSWNQGGGSNYTP